MATKKKDENLVLNEDNQTGGALYIDTEAYRQKQEQQAQANANRQNYISLVQQYQNPEPFQYDYESDPLYQNYLESYSRQGKTAMNDTLAQVSARTGGLASSYAGQAAQQAYDSYLSKAADKIPELYNLRYNEWKDRNSQLLNQIQLAQELDNSSYNRGRDTIADERYADELAYSRERDAIADERYQNEWDYQVAQDKLANYYKYKNSQEDNVSKLLKIAQTTNLPSDWANYYTAAGLNQTQVDAAMDNSGYNATYTPGKTSVTEGEFNRSSAMVQQYGTYQNYLKQTGGRTYTEKPADRTSVVTSGYSAMSDAFSTAKEKGLTDEDFYQYVENAGYKAGLTDAEIEKFFKQRGM